jgi:hypothetical protein
MGKNKAPRPYGVEIEFFYMLLEYPWRGIFRQDPRGHPKRAFSS